MTEKRPELGKTHDAATSRKETAFSHYQSLIVGRTSAAYTLFFELCLLLGPLPGAAGIFLRKIFWPRLFGSCGAGALFASGIVLRHPGRIHIGDRAIFSEGCICDARNPASDRALTIGDDVTLSNNVMLSCKDGSIAIGSRAGIGAQTIVHSAHGNPVSIGSDVVIGPRSYIVGGGNYNSERLDIPIWRQGIRDDGGVVIEEDVWLGAGVTVLGGVTMGKGSIAGAGAVVTKSMPPGSVCAGVPARIVRMRTEKPDH